MPDTPTDKNEQVLEAIRAGGQEREEAIRSLYEDTSLYRSIAKTVSDYGGFDPDIKEIFQESIILFDKMVRTGDFKNESSINTFINGISRNLCRNWGRTKTRLAVMGEEEVMLRLADTYIDENHENPIDEELRSVLGKILDQLQPVCRSVLRMWQLNYTMAEIADYVGLGSAANARKRKYRCLNALIQLINNSPGTQNYLKEVWKTGI